MSKYSFEEVAEYVDGLMTEEQKKQFEADLSVDRELQNQLSVYKEVNARMALLLKANKHEDQQGLEASLKEIHKEYFNNRAQSPKVVSMKRYLTRAVAIAAILVIAVFFWQPWHKDLYADYGQVTMAGTVERGNETDNLLEQATVAFNKKEFGRAGRLLKEVRAKDSSNALAHYYYGVALIKSGQDKDGRSSLEQVYAGNSVFRYEAAFFIALSYVKEGANEEAGSWLKKIPEDAGNYKKAQELLKKLEKM